MKKIILSILCLLFILVNFTYLEVEAVDETNSVSQSNEFDLSDYQTIDLDLLDYYTSANGVTITSCDRSVSGNIILPETINGYPVKRIDKEAFIYCYGLESIIIPEGVTSIGDDAFYYCDYLKSIQLPSTLTSIGREAFYSCDRLESIVIPEGVTEIPWNTFNYCRNLKKVILPSTLTSIGNNAFSDCTSLESIIIPEGVTNIGDAAFASCESLESITIPEGVTSISDCAFSGCISLESITIPEGVTSIGDGAFSGCISLESITIPNGITAIGDRTFSGCINIETITIPEGVTTIGNNAFINCANLRLVEIPEGVTSIGDYAFAYCDSLPSLIIPKGVTYIGKGVFEVCPNLIYVEIPESVQSIAGDFILSYTDYKLVLGVYKESYAEQYAVDKGYLYYYLDGTEAENNITGKRGNNFSWTLNKKLQKLTIECNGKMINFTNGEAPWIDYKEFIREVEITGNCLSISDSVFYEYNMSKVTLPDTLQSIGDSVFYDCKYLKTIELPDSLTDIGDSAFYNCDLIETLELPDNLKNIGKGTFELCGGFKTILIPKGLESIGDNAFSACTGLETVTILEGTTYIGADAFSKCSNLKSLELPNSITSIEKNAFLDCISLESIIMPEEAPVMIGPYAFSGCESLPTITIPEGTQSIGTAAFYRCLNLKTVKLPSTLQTIGNSAFMRCESLESVVIPKGVTTIEPYVFSDCVSLESIIISESVTSIGDFVFRYCESLEKIIVKSFDCHFGYNPLANPNAIIYSYKGSGAETYAKNMELYFEEIEKINASKFTVSIPYNLITYTGSEIKPAVTVKSPEGDLVCDSNYDVKYSNNINAGTATLVVTFKGMYSGTITKTFKIVKKDASKLTASLTYTSMVYNGAGRTQKVTVKDKTKTLTNNTDYTVTYSNNKNVGTAKVTITFKGNYTGTITKTFNITPCDASGFTVNTSYKAAIYSGTDKKPAVTVLNKKGNKISNVYYTVKYSNNKNAGTARVTVTFKGNYKGTAAGTFQIQPKDASKFNVGLSFTKSYYSGTEKKPVPTIVNNGTKLVKGTDYSVTYSNNVKVGIGKVIIKYKGNYKGTVEGKFTIAPKAVTKLVAELYGYDDVEVRWQKSTGASGYLVYFKKVGDVDYTYAGNTTNKSYKIKDLKDGKKYTFKVVAYFKDAKGTKHISKYATTSVYTLKTVNGVDVKKYSSTKVKVTFTNINGETGYQISRSTSKTGTNIITSTTAASKTLTVTKKKTYYYKVRAYYVREDGKKVYGPWSSPVMYVLK